MRESRHLSDALGTLWRVGDHVFVQEDPRTGLGRRVVAGPGMAKSLDFDPELGRAWLNVLTGDGVVRVDEKELNPKPVATPARSLRKQGGRIIKSGRQVKALFEDQRVLEAAMTIARTTGKRTCKADQGRRRSLADGKDSQKKRQVAEVT